MKKHYLYLLLLGLLAFGNQACETPEKVMKSNDIEYKQKKAIYWYNKKEYFKCIPVFEELIGLMKGTKSTEDIYYMYCMANYKQGDYMIAAYHFKNFTTLYPNSEKSEDCLFMHARSYDKISPKFELDQTYTIKAIDAFQNFINEYPESVKLDTANDYIKKLRNKLEKKALTNAELYYKTENYKAAAVSFANLMVEYPDIDNTERITFMIEKSYFKYADNSISSKKVERYHKVIDSYKSFADRFPQSKYLKEAAGFEKSAHYKSVLAAFDHAEVMAPNEREKYFGLAIKEASQQLAFITEPKQIKACNDIIEKSYFSIIKNNFQMAEEFDTDSMKRVTQKVALFDQTVKSYYIFVDKFKNSKYSKEAEKLFALATENISKYNKNGQK